MCGERTVAHIALASWRVRAELVIGDVTYRVFR
jgi:hypothetical protein